jgi:hypothetical protein
MVTPGKLQIGVTPDMMSMEDANFENENQQLTIS